LRRVEVIIPDITLQLVAVLTRKCCEPVEKVRQLPGQIRALSRRREPPSAASPFVVEIFKPLRDFFGVSSSASVVVGGLGAPAASTFRGVGRALREEYGRMWATDILEVVSSR
jgi:mevalonate kinase